MRRCESGSGLDPWRSWRFIWTAWFRINALQFRRVTPGKDAIGMRIEKGVFQIARSLMIFFLIWH